MAYSDFSLPFILNIDASGDGLGAILYQCQEGQKKVIAYASRSLRGSEKIYPAHKRKVLALKLAVTDKFHEYGNKFKVRTDNNYLLTFWGRQSWTLQGIVGYHLLLIMTLNWFIEPVSPT